MAAAACPLWQMAAGRLLPLTTERHCRRPGSRCSRPSAPGRPSRRRHCPAPIGSACCGGHRWSGRRQSVVPTAQPPAVSSNACRAHTIQRRGQSSRAGQQLLPDGGGTHVPCPPEPALHGRLPARACVLGKVLQPGHLTRLALAAVCKGQAAGGAYGQQQRFCVWWGSQRVGQVPAGMCGHGGTPSPSPSRAAQLPFLSESWRVQQKPPAGCAPALAMLPNSPSTTG